VNNNLFNYWKSTSYQNNIKEIKSFNINFGPQHPAAHGVLRMILQLRGEIVEQVDTHIGLLHRGSEKLMETKNYLLGLPYVDRMDYVSVLSQEHGFCLAVEYLLGSANYNSVYSQVRVLFDEITRILNHLMGVCTHSLDVGCMAPLFWGFEEREKLMEFYERVSGARMHAAFYRPNDLSTKAITVNLLKDIVIFSRLFLKRLYMIENKLNLSSIWRHRLVDVGIIPLAYSNFWGLSGVMARSTGLKSDLRLSYSKTYANYFNLTFRSFTGIKGDSYDRYLIRMREMAESVNIMTQIITKLTSSFSQKSTKKTIDLNSSIFFSFLDNISAYSLNLFKKSNQLNWYNSMEELISHFKYYSEGFLVPRGVTYKSVESPRGEFGVFLISDGSNKPYRIKIRSPAYYNLQPVEDIIKGIY
jgi:NADH-quinone oxidoreductase subunit D